MARERIVKKFGRAAESAENLCRPAEEEVQLEPSQATMVDDEESFWIESIEKSIGLTKPVQKYKAMRYDDEDTTASASAPSQSTGAPAAGANGRYVPPSRREGASATSRFDSDRDDKTLRVTNLGETVRDGDLLQLFSTCGRVGRVFLARDPTTGLCRGFAFITMITREAAETAIQKLNGHAYDYFILKVEWAQPPPPK